MKKKLLFLVLILAAVGGGFWYFQSNLNQKYAANDSQIDLSEQENLSVNDSELNEIESLIPEPTAEILDLKALAIEIIGRPIIVKAQLLDSVRKQATDKLNESMSIIQQNYDYPEAWYDLGAYRKLIGDYEGAIEAWDFVGLIRPKNYVSYSNLGDLYAFYLKDYKKGENNFLKAIINNPENVNSYLQLAALYEYAYKEKSAETENILLLGIQSNPSDAALKITLAQYYERNGRKADALEYFEEALKLDPSNNLLREEINKLKNS